MVRAKGPNRHMWNAQMAHHREAGLRASAMLGESEDWRSGAESMMKRPGTWRKATGIHSSFLLAKRDLTLHRNQGAITTANR